jgi:hypothetical protein
MHAASRRRRFALCGTSAASGEAAVQLAERFSIYARTADPLRAAARRRMTNLWQHTFAVHSTAIEWLGHRRAQTRAKLLQFVTFQVV